MLLVLFTQYKVHYDFIIELTDFLPGPYDFETEVRARIGNSLMRKRGSDWCSSPCPPKDCFWPFFLVQISLCFLKFKGRGSFRASGTNI